MHFKSIPTLLQTNLHFLWVILFFIAHGYSQSYQLVPFKDLLILACQILIAGIALFLLNCRLLRSKIKAGIFTSAILFIILFFGVFQDFFADSRWLSVLSYLRPLILVCLVVIFLLFFYLKRTKRSFGKTIVYINSLFLVYLLMETGRIFFLPSSTSNQDGQGVGGFKLPGCDTCKLPSVYLVVMDEYLGSAGLEKYFNYANTSIENFLGDRDFRVLDNTTSNYQFTLFSMASMLNMRYIPEVQEEKMEDRYVYNRVLVLLKNNLVSNLFQRNGYKIVNLSPFEIRNAPSEFSSKELPQRIELITGQTMTYRIWKYLPVWLSEMKIAPRTRREELTIVDANESAMKRAIEVAESHQDSPVFTYVHLMMPHSPFVYDSLGRRTGLWSQDLSREEADKAYLQYLVYTNRRIEKFIAQLQAATKRQAIIQLVSDHGYRPAGEGDIRYAYQTFNAVFLPGKDYRHWYDGMSNVNQYRALINSLFGERISLLKDSIVYQNTPK